MRLSLQNNTQTFRPRREKIRDIARLFCGNICDTIGRGVRWGGDMSIVWNGMVLGTMVMRIGGGGGVVEEIFRRRLVE